MNALIVERNKLVARKIARVLVSTGWTTQVVDEPSQAAEHVGSADLLCADAFDGDYLSEQVRGKRGMRGLLWTAEPLKRSLRYVSEVGNGTLDHVLARKDFESAPRTWELAMTARRLLEPSAVAPLGAYLDWGYRAREITPRTTAERDEAVAAIQDFVLALAVPKRVAELFGELGHELIMNAMYDAPIDLATGAAKFSADRKAEIALAPAECPTVRVASDGTRLILQVRDPFGRLERRHVVDGLVRGFASGEMDREHGGAGLGMIVCHNASAALFFDVARGKHTEVTALFELDQNLRDLRTQAKSLHVWSD